MVARSSLRGTGLDVGCNDRLTQEQGTRFGGNFTENNAYDGADNAMTFRNVTRTFNANNQLTSVNGVSNFTYDGNGNPTTYGGKTATYDAGNRLTSYPNIANTTWSATYRADNLRARTQASASSTPSDQMYFYYDGGNAVLEKSGTGFLYSVNVFAPDGLVIYSDYGGGNREDFLVDFLGSVTGTTLSDGSGSSYTRYKPYGSTYLGATTQFYRWTGQSGSQVMGITFAEQYNRSRFISLRLMRYATATSDLRSPYIIASPLSQPSPFGDGANSYIGPLNSGPNTLKIYRLPGSDIKFGNIGFRTGFLPQTEPNFTGGVIQLVTKMLFAIDCKRKLILIELKRYLEVWPIKNRKWVDIQMNGEDMFALQSHSECTKGLLLTQGIAGLYRFDHKLLSDWIPPHGVEKLLTSNNLSIFKGGTTFKELAFAWDCCSFLENWEFRAKCGPDENYANGFTRIKEGDPCCE